MKKFTSFSSIAMPLDRANIDTDAIIPKQFLKSIKRSGFGPNLFDEWRYLDHGEPGMDNSKRPINPEFVLNDPKYSEAQILLTRRNFGCGSSREHAPWALLDYGIKAVISTEIADIFFNNSLKNGFIPIRIDEESHHWLLSNPGVDILIDINELSIDIEGFKKLDFYMDPFSKYCLLNGIDQLGFIMNHKNEIDNFEKKL